MTRIHTRVAEAELVRYYGVSKLLNKANGGGGGNWGSPQGAVGVLVFTRLPTGTE